MLRARLGEDVYSSWFHSLEFVSFDGETVRMSVPVKFLRNWIETHYAEDLLACCERAFDGAARVEVMLREPRGPAVRPPQDRPAAAQAGRDNASGTSAQVRSPVPRSAAAVLAGKTQAGSLEGSPLDPRYTFASFVVGPSNRLAHAGATQVAETVLSENRGINPLYVHSPVGLGKTHLLQAIAWEVKRRTPHAKVLYLTAERFRYQFVDALRSQDAMAFKDRFRSIDILLIDDLEFMQGPQTEQEFDHIVNALLDGGKQVVVASARAPAQIERLNDRMRSRLQRGLVTSIEAPNFDLRRRILEKRVQEKRVQDSAFTVPNDVLNLLAERLTESGRELEGAVTRMHATWKYMRVQITSDVAETVVRDLVHSQESRRIKIDDILKVISRHYGISKGDILSARRHRSVVWPRQIGMYLAKQLTSRSLPEIGRRFGNRDHTTVLHAVRKIEGKIGDDVQLRGEIDELKKLLNNC
ncbi:MAG: chromosomal replication initiator protein DnaA [Hyphomicrobiaceae bacterium]